eukprot:Blabericola_migrator_1__6516@NODE_3288_length_1884_cov_146_633462_g2054_i0_p1_GENE_NODE_3288_length_1884_cov_146_633462_g2054_i0NODE_3288_length_1884_cov_146_633462_g2054_i0_p1_ORF_typecomplete_len300_score54_45TFIIE_beta/PF02186_15/0_00088TFIIE_beta/PF02186_15/9_5e03XPCbinding/PF09280_11/6_8e03XPCbinding/PF09280_11/0_42_NODE_3288_length_1884_cov_146_633462_g2054_i08951794
MDGGRSAALGASENSGSNAAGGVSDRLLQGQSLGYILLRCQDTLKSFGKPVSTYDLQVSLINSGAGSTYDLEYYQSLFADPAFVSVLRNNPRIVYDTKTRKWSYASPFAEYTSMEKLKQGIQSEPDGLEVTQELIEHHPNMADWIQQLLEKRCVRAFRATKAVRCKSYSAESGFQCDLYDIRTNKCDNCALLKGLVLYGKARHDAEDPEWEANDANFKVDEDLKEMWANIQIPAMEAILEDMKVKNRVNQMEKKKKPRRKGPWGARGSMMPTSSRVNKIANAHIYTMEEFKAELNSKPE